MQAFNFKRVMLLIKRDIFSEPKTYRNYLLGGFLAILFGMIGRLYAINVWVYDISEWAASFALSNAAGITLFICIFLWMIATSLTFKNLFSRGMRINNIMLPASSMEKYVSRILQTLIIFPIVLIVFFLAADVIQWGFFSCIKHSIGFVTPYIIDAIGNALEGSEVNFNGTTQNILMLPLFILSNLSTYVLGSTIFKKQPFILTSLCMFVATFAFFFAIGTLLPHFDLIENVIKYGDMTTFVFVCNLIMVVWITFCFWMSYRLFNRTTVITTRRVGI